MAPLTHFQKAEFNRVAYKENQEFLDTELKRHSTTPLTQREVEIYAAEVEDTRKHLIANNADLISSAPTGTDMDALRTEYRSLFQMATRIDSGFHGIKMSFPAATGSPTSTAPSTSQSIKLPALTLPKFSGNLEDWVSFRDLFINTVDKSSLSKVEKLTQLKSLVIGEAARQIRSLTLSETNYDIAWTALKERYENNRELLFSIIRRIMNQPVIVNCSAINLRTLIDTTKECVRSLEVLKIPTQHWNAILIYVLFSKLDPTSREQWEQSLPNTEVPELSKLYEFLEQRARALAASSVPPQRPPHRPPPTPRSHHTSPTTCKLGCTQPHPLFKCLKFRNQTPQQRCDTIKRLNFCMNCLSDGHVHNNCNSKFTCKHCNKKHNTMLHFDNASESNGDKQPPQHGSRNHHVTPPQEFRTSLLATAKVKVAGETSTTYARALLDGGSTNSHITEKLARSLNLRLTSCDIPMSGLDSAPLGTASYVTAFQIKPHFLSNISFNVVALVVESIGKNIPFESIQWKEWTHIDGLTLADPQFHRPAKVDLLLGSDVFWETLQDGRRKGKEGQPLAVNSTLGWLIAGSDKSSTPVSVFNSNLTLDTFLRKFWEYESLPDDTHLSKDDQLCETQFQSSYQRDRTGKFIVKMPFRDTQEQQTLGDSRRHAISRFLSMERRFTTATQLKDSQRSLLKESSTTTKLRVVFNASASTNSNKSLNKLMLKGPQLQDPLTDIMLRFRTHLVAFVADVEKMYRQIWISPQQRDLQRIIWRDHPSLQLQEYRLNTVTYGTTSAPYLAIKCLQTLAEVEQNQFPLGSKVMLNDFYVDDTNSGAPDLESARETVKQLIGLASSGGFQLRKWATNSSDLLQSIPENLRETNSVVEMQTDSVIKTLGIFWNPRKDIYSFRLSLPPDTPGKYTKRTIISEIAKIYDPLGWLSPVIIGCKIFMQDLWKTSYDWDDILETELQNKWINLKNSLQHIEKLEIPRCLYPRVPAKLYLIGCCDASVKALSAVIYIYSEYENHTPTCRLLTSKTRVAPVKHVTLPRLELNAAVLLSQLLVSVHAALKLTFEEVRAYTDSTITYHWITSDPLRWKPYIRRRVLSIQEGLQNVNWFHIPGSINPADCASRGITSMELLEHPLWWNGTEYFRTAPKAVNLQDEDLPHLELIEKTVTTHHAATAELHPIFQKYSSYRKLQRVVCYILRFLNNWCRRKSTTPMQKGHLTVHELSVANNFVLRCLQTELMAKDYKDVISGKELCSKSRLANLDPFISADGLLRVGGRLRHSNLPLSQKHPILLPRKCHVTKCIVMDMHIQLLHAGPTATLTALQQQFWITNGRDTVRFILRKCIPCARQRSTTMTQMMGNLPKHRITPSRPFSKAGVDLAGPFSIRPMVRSKVTLKCWLAVFVCFSTRAVNIEVVSSLTSDCFIAALRRFMGKFGKPSDMYSDNGTNFHGADKILSEFAILVEQPKVKDECLKNSIVWHFSPAGAPHFGGIWEAGVKSMKHHLKRVMGSTPLTYEEMLTLTTQIQGIMNSRPIVPASTDPGDLEALTPAHFLIGAPITSAPEPCLLDTKLGYVKRWQLVQQQQQLFWKRWSSEYLSRLQQRPKWIGQQPNLEVGNMVLVKEERLPPMRWRLGRIVAVHPGADLQVRVATIRTADGEIKRPIVKLSLLPITDNEK